MERTHYNSKFNYWLLLPISVIPIMILGPILISNMDPNMKIYESDFQKVIDKSDAECFNLQLITKTSGQGLFALDPIESKLRDEAQHRLDIGDCKK